MIAPVASKVWHGDGGVTLCLGVGAAVVAAPLVAAFALVRCYPAVAFLVGLVALNVFLFLVLGFSFSSLSSLSHAIGSSIISSLLRYLLLAYAYCAYTFLLYYFYGAYHSLTYVEREDETNDADEEVGH